MLIAQIKMLEDEKECKTLCVVDDVNEDDAKFINDRIREDYALNWLIDGLPAAEMKNDTRTGDVFFDIGFNLGNDEGAFEHRPALNNHYDIVLKYVVIVIHYVTLVNAALQLSSAFSRYLPRSRCTCMAF